MGRVGKRGGCHCQVRVIWDHLQRRCGSPKAAAEEFFEKLVHDIPKARHMQKRASTVWGKFGQLLAALQDQTMLKREMEYLALRHMGQEITLTELDTFKRILAEFLSSKLGSEVTPEVLFAFNSLIDALGTSYQRTHEAHRAKLKMISACWTEVKASAEPESQAFAFSGPPASQSGRAAATPQDKKATGKRGYLSSFFRR